MHFPEHPYKRNVGSPGVLLYHGTRNIVLFPVQYCNTIQQEPKQVTLNEIDSFRPFSFQIRGWQILGYSPRSVTVIARFAF